MADPGKTPPASGSGTNVPSEGAGVELPHSMPDSVINAANQAAFDLMGFLNSYKGLNEKAVTTPIHGQDFRSIDGYLSGIWDRDEKQIRAAMVNAATTNSAITQEDVDKTLRAFKDGFHDLLHNSELSKQAYATAELNKAFVRDHVKNGGLNQPVDSAKTEQELLHGILTKSDGFGLADVHNSDRSLTLLTRNMEQLKKDGVTAIYTEVSGLEDWQKLSLPELKQLAKDGKYQNIVLQSAEDTAKFYGVAHSDNTPLETLKLNIAARENGIRVVYIDKMYQVAREQEDMQHRVAAGNYMWTDSVREDQKEHPGKYVVLGGLAHFSSVKSTDGLGVFHGMVGKALGIPVLSYEKTDDKAHLMRKGTNPNGPDYYLSGGKDYMNSPMEVIDAKRNFIELEKTNPDYHADPTVSVPNKIPAKPASSEQKR